MYSYVLVCKADLRCLLLNTSRMDWDMIRLYFMFWLMLYATTLRREKNKTKYKKELYVIVFPCRVTITWHDAHFLWIYSFPFFPRTSQSVMKAHRCATWWPPHVAPHLWPHPEWLPSPSPRGPWEWACCNLTFKFSSVFVLFVISPSPSLGPKGV